MKRKFESRFFGSVNRVPEQEPGSVAMCCFCDWAKFFPDRKRKVGSSFSRAMRALRVHVLKAHPDKALSFWKGNE